MTCPQTDVVVPVHEALDCTRQCVETLLASTPALNRVIFVDDFSSTPTAKYLWEVLGEHPTWLLIRTGQQKWFSRASNLGLRMVRTERSVLLNSDCIMNPGWLEELYDVWGDAESKGMRVGLVGSVWNTDESRRWIQTIEPNYTTGHCWLLRVGVLQEASEKRNMPGWYFSELEQGQIHINSDRILCYELNRMGYTTISSFKSPVGHLAGQSWGHDLTKLSRLRVGDQMKGEILSR